MQRSLLLFEEGIKSPHTKKVYRGHLDAFLKFVKISDPDKLLKLSQEQLQILLEDYVFHIKKRINPNSVPTSLQWIKHFFTMSDVMTNWKKLAKFYPEKIKISESRFVLIVAVHIPLLTKIRCIVRVVIV